jgi:hypothetical protein
MTFARCLIVGLLTITSFTDVFAASVFTATEESGGVTIEGFGSINTSILNLHLDDGFADGPGIFGTPPVVVVGQDGSRVALYIDDSLVGPSSIGPLNSSKKADSGEGDFFGIVFLFPINTAEKAIVLPRNYISGSELSGSARYDGESFATLGIVPGVYTWTWGSPGNADSMTVRIGVPEPHAFTLLCLGPICLLRRR